MKVADFDSRIGVTNTVINNARMTVTYRIDFPGAGCVAFQVLPGETFDFIALIKGVSLNVEKVAPDGISPVPDAHRAS